MAAIRRETTYTFLCTIWLIWLIPSFSPVGAQFKPSLTQPFNVRWQFKTEETSNVTPVAGPENVYLPLAAGTVTSLRAADGTLSWRTELGGEISASPAVDERGVYVATETRTTYASSTPLATGALRMLSRQNGVTLWVRTLPAPIQGTLVSNQTVVFGGASDGRFYAVSKETGETQWVKQHSSPFFSSPVILENRLYIGDEEGNLLVVDSSTGQTLQHYQTRGAVRTSAAITGGMIFIGSTDNYVYAIDERTRRLRWKTRTGAGVQSIVATNKGLLVTSLDNFVYLLSANRGKKIWKRRLAGRIAAQPLALGDAALFAPLAGDECVVLSLNDGKIVNSLPVGEDNNMSASPITVGNLILLTTRKGLVAFASSSESGNPP